MIRITIKRICNCLGRFELTLGVSVLAVLTLITSAYPVPPDSLGVNLPAAPSWWQFFKMIIILCIVLVMIYVTVLMFRKLTGMRATGSRNVALLGGVPLGPRRSLQFVKIASRVYLIGVTEHHISLIDTIQDADEIESLISQDEGGGSLSASFARYLSKFAGKDSGHVVKDAD